MSKFKSLTDDQLLEETRKSISTEISATTNVVRHFRAIYDRALHLQRGFSSMFKMATKEFGYDRSAAQRRINAMELSIAVPWILTAIDRKRLCLQAAADIQTFLNLERGLKRALSSEQTVQLVKECLDLSTRKIQMKLACLNPRIDFTESKKFVSADRIEVKHTMSVAIEEKLERVKLLLSHVNPYLTREGLLDYLAEMALEKLDPERKITRIEKRKSFKAAVEIYSDLFTAGPKSKPETMSKTKPETMSKTKPEMQTKPEPLILIDEVVSEAGEIQLAADLGAPKSRYIRAAADREVRRRNADRGCEFIDAKTGRKCGSRHQLQRDHLRPYSRGGSNFADNLQLLCAQHNRFKFRQSREVAAQ